jgi:hypothetical protein
MTQSRSRPFPMSAARTQRVLLRPRTWGLIGRISDLIPHFGYGVLTALVLRYLYPPPRPSAAVATGTGLRVQGGVLIVAR